MKPCPGISIQAAPAIFSDERNILSGKLHDHLGQELVCLKMAAHRLNSQIRQSGNPEHIGQMQDLMEMIEGILGTVREVAKDLKPRVLHEFGLISAIRNEVSEIKKSRSVNITVELETNELDFHTNIEMEVLKVLRESLLAHTGLKPQCDLILKISKDERFGRISIFRIPESVRNKKLITEFTFPLLVQN